MFLFLLRIPVFANSEEEVLFEDNFTSLDSKVWNISNSGGVVSIDNGLLLKANDSRQFPFVYLRNNYIPTDGDYFIDVDYEFPEVTDFGVGIGVGNTIPNYGILQPEIETIDREYIYYLIWRGKNDLHLFQSRHCELTGVCDLNRTTLFQKQYIDGVHSVRIKYTGNEFVVFADGVQITNPILLDSQRRPTTLWIGNPTKLDTPQNWTSVKVIGIKVGKIVDMQMSRKPVIVLPGFGASWDMAAFLSGTAGNNWKIPEQITIYNGLINSFKNAGYKEGEDLFVFSYDWRKPLDSLADDLKKYILNNNLQDKKIDLVGHSMGGLVARSYAQKYGVAGIDKITTSGTPHLGVLDAYGLWEGAVFWDDIWWEKAIVEIITEANRYSGETKIDAVRRVAPSIKDLLPTTDFLKLNSKIVSKDNLKQKNSYLSDLNSNTTELDKIITTFWSSDQQTRTIIDTIKPTPFDTLLKRWEDGKPAATNPFSLSEGDGSVTKQSAKGPFTNSIKALGGHNELMTRADNIASLLNNLGIKSENVVAGEIDNRQGVFVAMLRSPGKLKICDEARTKCDSQLGIYLPENKIFILPGYKDEKLTVQVLADGLGEYSLHLGNLDSEGQWETVLGNIQSTNQIDTYIAQGESLQISSDEDTGDRSILNAKKRLRFFSSGWDKLNITEKLANTKTTSGMKLLSAGLLRLSLKDEIAKARRTNNSQHLDAVINMWNAIDQITEKVLIEKRFYRLGGYHLLGNSSWFFNEWLSRNKFESDKYRSYFSTVLINLASDKYNEAKETPTTYPRLKADRILQAEMLTQFAREIR